VQCEDGTEHTSPAESGVNA